MPKLLAALLVGMVSLMLATNDAKADEVMASCYGAESGGVTASGSVFDPTGLTAAHPYLPFGTVLLVSHAGSSVSVTVNDRGPFAGGRGIDLSCGAMVALGVPPGVYLVDTLVL